MSVVERDLVNKNHEDMTSERANGRFFEAIADLFPPKQLADLNSYFTEETAAGFCKDAGYLLSPEETEAAYGVIEPIYDAELQEANHRNYMEGIRFIVCDKKNNPLVALDVQGNVGMQLLTRNRGTGQLEDRELLQQPQMQQAVNNLWVDLNTKARIDGLKQDKQLDWEVDIDEQIDVVDYNFRMLGDSLAILKPEQPAQSAAIKTIKLLMAVESKVKQYLRNLREEMGKRFLPEFDKTPQVQQQQAHG